MNEPRISPEPHRRPLGQALKEAGKALSCVAFVVLVPGAWFVITSPCQVRARADWVQANLRGLEQALRQHHARTGQLPEMDRGLRDLVDAGLLRERHLKDPWGNPFTYTVNDGEVEVSSLGADGVPGGEEEDADAAHRFRLSVDSGV